MIIKWTITVLLAALSVFSGTMALSAGGDINCNRCEKFAIQFEKEKPTHPACPEGNCGWFPPHLVK